MILRTITSALPAAERWQTESCPSSEGEAYLSHAGARTRALEAHRRSPALGVTPIGAKYSFPEETGTFASSDHAGTFLRSASGPVQVRARPDAVCVMASSHKPCQASRTGAGGPLEQAAADSEIDRPCGWPERLLIHTTRWLVTQTPLLEDPRTRRARLAQQEHCCGWRELQTG